MTTDVKGKKGVSITVLTISQLLIYYPMAITGWLYHPPLHVHETMKGAFVKLTGIPFGGGDMYVVIVGLLSSTLATMLVFKVLFPQRRYFYTNKTAWFSIIWNLAIQIGIYFLCIFYLFLMVGGRIEYFLGVLLLVLLCFGSTSFIGTISSYVILSKMTNKRGGQL